MAYQKSASRSSESNAPTGVLRRRGFRILLMSTGSETIGDDIVKTLLPLAAVSLLGAGALEVGIINALGMAAFLLIGVPAGTWVDRMNKRRVMIAADLIRCLAVLGVPIAYALGSLELWQILLVATVLGFADVFYSTASSTVLPRIVEAPQISEATARILTLDTTLGMSAPVLASGLIKVLGIAYAFTAAPLAYLTSALAISRLPLPSEPTGPSSIESTTARARFISSAMGGLKFTVNNQHIRPLFISNMFVNSSAMFGGGAEVVFALTVLDVPVTILTAVGAISAAGALVGSLAAGRILSSVGIGPTRIVVSLLSAPLVLVVPFSLQLGIPPLVALSISGFGWAFCTAINVVAGSGVVPRLTPQAMLGRVSANVRLFTLGIMPMASIAGGFMADIWGLVPAMIGWAVLAGLAAVPIGFSPLRHWKHFPHDLDVNTTDNQRQPS